MYIQNKGSFHRILCPSFQVLELQHIAHPFNSTMSTYISYREMFSSIPPGHLYASHTSIRYIGTQNYICFI